MKINELVTRRSAVATLALGAASACLVLGDGQVYADDAKPETLVGTQYGFLVEARRCVNCQNCVEACRKVNGTPDRRRVTRYESDFGAEIYISTSCMHCEKPSCADVCPAGAINKRSDGIVVVDNSRCIGCK